MDFQEPDWWDHGAYVEKEAWWKPRQTIAFSSASMTVGPSKIVTISVLCLKEANCRIKFINVSLFVSFFYLPLRTFSFDDRDNQFDQEEIDSAQIQQVPIITFDVNDPNDGDRRMESENQTDNDCFQDVKWMADPATTLA